MNQLFYRGSGSCGNDGDVEDQGVSVAAWARARRYRPKGNVKNGLVLLCDSNFVDVLPVLLFVINFL